MASTGDPTKEEIAKREALQAALESPSADEAVRFIQRFGELSIEGIYIKILEGPAGALSEDHVQILIDAMNGRYQMSSRPSGRLEVAEHLRSLLLGNEIAKRMSRQSAEKALAALRKFYGVDGEADDATSDLNDNLKNSIKKYLGKIDLDKMYPGSRAEETILMEEQASFQDVLVWLKNNAKPDDEMILMPWAMMPEQRGTVADVTDALQAMGYTQFAGGFISMARILEQDGKRRVVMLIGEMEKI